MIAHMDLLCHALLGSPGADTCSDVKSTAKRGAFVVRDPPHQLPDTHPKDVCLSVQAGPKVCHVLVRAVEVRLKPGKKATTVGV